MVTVRKHPLRLAVGRLRGNGMLEFTVQLPVDDAERLKDRASRADRTLGDQIRRDVRTANKTRGESYERS